MPSTLTIQSPPPPPTPPRFRTAEAWLASLGNIPLHRIVLDVPPGLATVMDVVRGVNGDDKRLVELVNGTLVEKAMGNEESEIAALVAAALVAFIRPRRLGRVTVEAAMVRMLGGNVRMPDVAFFRREDLPGGKFPSAAASPVAPVLAVEVLSKSNTSAEMGIKRNEYFDSGVREVWEIDPAARTAQMYTAPGESRLVAPESQLESPTLLPGFSLPLTELFDLE